MRFHARLIGEFSLTDYRNRNLLPATRKTRALIARVLLADGGSISRQDLVEFGWGDRDVEQGRASLRQALYEARVLTRGAQPLLRVSRTAVRADMEAFESDLHSLLAAARNDDLSDVANAVGERPLLLLSDCDGASKQIDAWLAAERQVKLDLIREEVRAALVRAEVHSDSWQCSQLNAFVSDGDRIGAPAAPAERALAYRAQSTFSRQGLAARSLRAVLAAATLVLVGSALIYRNFGRTAGSFA